MNQLPPLYIYNSLTRRKEVFEPINPPFVGMYVCGPTVYGDPHLGHARSAITFDVVYRYLLEIGYKVRYVRNITDVGHLENDSDSGEDKIAKKARIEQLEPMEVAQYYTNRYHEFLDKLNVKKPSIEPLASGHIIEQIALVKQIINEGLAYEVNGSVYFDVQKYHQQKHYGKLSGRVIEELLANTRDLEGQDEKRSPLDFALWKKAAPEHIMRWESPWGQGFPGWHIECTAMSTKYLGETFDIHGGGMDLLFPHHECEIAQAQAANHKDPCKYWMHNNMVTINGQKMGKSLNNFITLDQFFSGTHPALEKAYNPMTIRFFILQAHYRSTLDFSNEALQAAEKGLARLFKAIHLLDKITTKNKSTLDIAAWNKRCEAAIADDFNTPILIAELFDAVRMINLLIDGKESITSNDLNLLKEQLNRYVVRILGLTETVSDDRNEIIDDLMQLILDIRKKARENKDYATSDTIRDRLTKLKIKIKDAKDSSTWEFDI